MNIWTFAFSTFPKRITMRTTGIFNMLASIGRKYAKNMKTLHNRGYAAFLILL